MKIIKLVVLLVLISGCNQEERIRHVSNLYYVNEGDSPNEVVNKMKSQPDRVIYSDSLYLWQEKIYDLTTFIYYAPRAASSNIHIYFKECEVLHIYYD